ncbi:MAG: hypothetical protein AB1486_10285 [Planctomycetota bacterium]
MMRKHSCAVFFAAVLITVTRLQGYAQLVENKTSLDPVSNERFGHSLASGRLTITPQQEWLIMGVPNATVAGILEAGEVEFQPVNQQPPFVQPFKISAPPGHIQQGAHFGYSVAAADINKGRVGRHCCWSTRPGRRSRRPRRRFRVFLTL